uniref:DUF3455 domain-containing protein n=1 Tax=Burkholderia sp. (strain CCGE1003) TaxID=640512 RepID=E1TJC2_BURSG
MSTKYLQSTAMVALTVSVLALGACALAPAAPAAASIDPPQGQPIMTLTASGIQIYSCEFDAQHRLGWVFQSPQATLFDRSGHAAVRHAAGPSWEAEDGSRIVGRVLSQRPSDNPASVPQLLLQTHSTAGSGVLSAVRYVQRIHTVGGVMPAGACTTQGQVGSSPYLADYVFYQ